MCTGGTLHERAERAAGATLTQGTLHARTEHALCTGERCRRSRNAPFGSRAVPAQRSTPGCRLGLVQQRGRRPTGGGIGAFFAFLGSGWPSAESGSSLESSSGGGAASPRRARVRSVRTRANRYVSCPKTCLCRMPTNCARTSRSGTSSASAPIHCGGAAGAAAGAGACAGAGAGAALPSPSMGAALRHFVCAWLSSARLGPAKIKRRFPRIGTAFRRLGAGQILRTA